MKSAFDRSITVTVTRTALIPADPYRQTLILSSPLTNLVRVSTRPEVGGGGMILRPGQAPLILKLG